jgi:L-arabinonolactonase
MRKPSPEIRRVIDARNRTGETPVWSAAEQTLYWVDCHGPPQVQRWHPASGKIERWEMPERCGGIVLKCGGGGFVTLASGLYDLDFATGELARRVASPLPGHVALHECALDPAGRFWVGAIDSLVGPGNLHPGGAKLFRLDGDQLTAVIENISCANGLAFSPDGRTLYMSDSTTQRCDRYDLDPATGNISNKRTFFVLGRGDGFVDGAAVDCEGAYWATLVYAGRLRRYLPDGTLDLEIDLPFDNPTKPVFGGDGLQTVFLTSTSDTMGNPAANPLDGGVFAFEAEVAGLPEPLFAGLGD